MELNNMTGDPNQQNPPSVFRFEAYPGPSGVVPWNIADPYGKGPEIVPQTEYSPVYSRYVNQQIPPVNHPTQIPASFSFGVQSPASPYQGHFPFQITANNDGGYGDRTFKQILGKRKTDTPSFQPCKQHITEEKMAEHMSRLHISSETATSPLEPESVKNKRLYMCEEMRKLQSDPILPPSLVAGLQRPCTALVLWQPPIRPLPLFEANPGPSNNSNNEDLNKNSPDIKSMEILAEMEAESSNTMEMDA
ncbi:uncharacterized protein LOC115875877 [Sitophilus oryzae]|uniref:Uncharacterized protein LOC115875877 n=1 Tax=Sitophilus oryzae TaxID=7048 RepID=A0A6J2X7X0_SITOR|nr:uncharacterized protein LOC115875877 [Sitophilus oryzae]